MPDHTHAHAIDSAGSFALGHRLVRRVGYGAMQLAGDGVFGPPRNRDEALRVLCAAADAGVNHIDTAQYYGPGVVNELIRAALYPYPADLAIVSKVGARRDATGAVLPYDEPDQLLRGIEENLGILGIDRLAAVNLRMMNQSVTGRRFDAQLASLVRARQAGLIEGIGLSNITRRQLLRAVAQTEIVCVQNLFNLADQGSADVLEECARRGIAFVPFSPLGFRGASRTRSSPAPCSHPWETGCRPHRPRSPWPGFLTSHRTSSSSPAPAPARTWPKTSKPPPWNLTTPPARSWPEPFRPYSRQRLRAVVR